MKKIISGLAVACLFLGTQSAAAQTIMASEVDFSGVVQCPKDIYRAGEDFRVGQLCITKKMILKVIPTQKAEKTLKKESKAVKTAKKIIQNHRQDLKLAKKNLRNIKKLEKKITEQGQKQVATGKLSKAANKHLQKAEQFLVEASLLQTGQNSCLQGSDLIKKLKSATKHLEKACEGTSCSHIASFNQVESELFNQVQGISSKTPSGLSKVRQTIRSAANNNC